MRSAVQCTIHGRQLGFRVLAFMVLCGTASAGLADVPPMKALVTDQAALSLPTVFSFPPGEAFSDNGDYFFTAGSGSGLFVLRAGASVPIRLFQAGDEVPGIAQSRADFVSAVRSNASGLIAFQFDYFAGDTTKSAIYTCSGSTFTKVAVSPDVAPGSGGSVFGRPVTLVGLNASGAVAFTAPLTPVGAPTGTVPKTAIFIAPAGGAPVRVIGIGDSAPGTGGTITAVTALGLNDFGEVVFRAAISGGSGGYGLFAGSGSGVRKVVANGDPKPGGGTFSITLSTQLASANLVKSNGTGQVAFLDNSSLYVSTPSVGLSVVLSPASTLPSPLESRTVSSTSLLAGFTDSGTGLVLATLTGTSTNNSALLRATSAGVLTITAFKGQGAPGLLGQAFDAFSQVGMNAAGDVGFRSTLNPNTPTTAGLFRVSSEGVLVSAALDGAVAPGGVGTIAQVSYSRVLADGSIYFETPLTGGTARHGAFHWTNGARTLVTDQVALPAGSRTGLRTIFPSGAGNYVGFTARRTGSHAGLFVHNAQTGATSKVIANGEYIPAVGAVVTVSVNTVFVLSDGSVVFPATPAFATSPFIFLWQPGGSTTKLVGVGDAAPGTGATFTACTLYSALIAPVSDTGQVLFKGTYSGGAGLFTVDKSGTVVSLSRSGQAAPSGGTFTTSSFAAYLISADGQVAFSGTTSTSASGIFIATPGIGVSKVAVTGDTAPGGGTFSAFSSLTPAGFNANGDVLFFASLSGGAGGGLFVGSATTAPTAVALNGVAAPAGGNYVLDSASKDARIDKFGNVLFLSTLSGGTSDSGLFLRRAGATTIETVAVQGQTAAGSAYPFGTFMATLNGYAGEFSALGPGGEVWFIGSLASGDHAVISLCRYRLDGTLEQVTVRGGAAPGGLGAAIGSISNGIGAGRPGRFFFRAVVTGSTVAEAIFGTVLPTPGDLTGDGQPDLAVFRPTDGTWYIKGQAPIAFGAAGDIPVPGDYNGDGANEVAMYRPSTGTWLVRGRTDVVFGAAGDIPAPADYDGDGTVDMAVFRPSAGSWLVRNGATISIGAPGDVPVPADYDGDGRAEAAVFRPSTGTWIIQGQDALAFGAPGDIPIPTDLFGAGVWTPTVFRPSTGTWEAHGVGGASFGLAGDVPMLFDVNLDGEPEPVVFRPSYGLWFTFDADTGTIPMGAFGLPGDLPVFGTAALLLGTQPTVVLRLHDATHTVLLNGAAAAGTWLHATALVSGPLSMPTGTMTFTWFANTTCSGTPTAAGTVALDSAGAAHPSDAVQVSAAGLSFLAHYSGDGAYSATDACAPIVVPASAPTFTDDPLVPGATQLRAVHVVELRQRIDELRARQGLASYPWAEPSLTTGVTVVKAAHVAELRAALAEVYAAAARPAPTFADPTLTAGSTVVKTVHLQEIRSALLTW